MLCSDSLGPSYYFCAYIPTPASNGDNFIPHNLLGPAAQAETLSGNHTLSSPTLLLSSRGQFWESNLRYYLPHIFWQE